MVDQILLIPPAQPSQVIGALPHLSSRHRANAERAQNGQISPSRPAGLSCSSSAIKTRLSNCTVAGVAEVACGEALEGADTRIMTGAMNGAACSAATAVAQGRQPNTGDAAGSAIIGAVDNVGESMGGFFGGAVRLMAAGVKAGVVSECKRDVRVQCDPEVALRPYRERLARYENCVNDQ